MSCSAAIGHRVIGTSHWVSLLRIFPWTSQIDYKQSVDIDFEFGKKQFSKIVFSKKYQVFWSYVFSIPDQFFGFKIFGTNQCKQIGFLSWSQWPTESPFSKGDDLKSIYKYQLHWHHLYLANQDHTVTITLPSLTFLLCFCSSVIPDVKHAVPFFKGFWKCSLSKGYATLAFFERLINFVYKSPLFQRFASTQIPFQIVLCHCALFQRFVDVSQLTPFFKGTSKQVPWDVKVSVKPCNLCEGLCQALISTLFFWLTYLPRKFHQTSFKKTSLLMPPKDWCHQRWVFPFSKVIPFHKGNSLFQRFCTWL